MAVTEKHATSDSTWTLGGEPWMDVWPVIETELRKVVSRRLPRDCDVADVLQEVCVRMLEARKAFSDPGEAVRYATTVACNYVRDLHRRRSRSLPADCFDHCSEDVERSVLARLRFEALAERVEALNPVDREAFADPRGDTSLKSGAMRVRRSRVRARLSASIESAVGGGFAWPRLRWLLAPASAAALLVPAFPSLPAEQGPAPGGQRYTAEGAGAKPSPDHPPDSGNKPEIKAPPLPAALSRPPADQHPSHHRP